ncbi:MAG TPA: N-acetyl-gamma-glutamyl-phosphate reductase [Microthrixaceae bacterium]|nr:N-acetyl-gamma-glutamyl-phosphate reductase [Microthrixaceae bacterium]
MTSVGIVGASGFAGSELLRLAASHPELDVCWATGDTQAGVAIADLYPGLAATMGSDVFVSWEPALLDHVEGVFLALPHGASQQMVDELVERDVWIVDLAADFRHVDPEIYPEWYGEAHVRPDLLGTFTYGLPELYRADIAGSRRVAAPGCYPTPVILGLAPLVRGGLIDPSKVIVDAASGASGAGRPPKPTTTFCTVDEDYTAYGLLDHRHTPEMEAHTGARVLFTPHLAPMNRGILATCYATPGPAVGSTDEILRALDDAYADEPFVIVSERSPSTKATLGSNCCHLSARFDERTNTVIVLGAIDNLVKGTAGQAIQCVNLMTGLPEVMGLPRVGLTP